jgi:cation diffusion facilitator CzcD-associated flavoprotein CzcO
MHFNRTNPDILLEEDSMTGGSQILTSSSARAANGVRSDRTIHENEWYNQDFDGFRVAEQPLYTKRRVRIICVGAGATGLQIAYKAERRLENVDLQIYEKNNDIGGTWLENRYPGCTCDIPSHAYQFTWARNPNWSSYYSSSREIWQYFKDIATKFNLERYVQFKSSVESATWHEDRGQYTLKITGADGAQFEDYCDILISGSGILNSWKYPNIPGLDIFKGKLMHSANWDVDFDLTNKKVAVIGGGSSAVQLIPSIQPKVKKLTAFLRSAAWITTGFGAKYAAEDGTNFEYSDEQKANFEKNPDSYVQYCRDVEGELNKRFSLMHTQDKDQLDSRSSTVDMMTKQLNGDPVLTKRMIPDFALGCRRMTPGSGYLQSLTKENVETVHKSVVRLTETGIVDESGTEHEVDVVICATGFDTSFTPHFQLTGRHGANIQEQFGDLPIGYLGITVDNFPNFFSKHLTATTP